MNKPEYNEHVIQHTHSLKIIMLIVLFCLSERHNECYNPVLCYYVKRLLTLSHCLSLHLVFFLSSFFLHSERALRAVPLAFRRFSDAHTSIVKPLYGALSVHVHMCGDIPSQ